MLRAVFIGAVELSYVLLEDLLAAGDLEIIGIVSREQSTFNSDFKTLLPLADQYDIPLLNVRGNDQESIADWIEKLNPDVVFCLGWSYLLSQRILRLPHCGVIGYHPALLPKNRGRHPLIWALALGLEETGSTFFKMNGEADAGPILNQRRLPISPDDDATSLYKKMIDCARGQLKQLAGELVANKLNPIPQVSNEATYWRKRSKDDGRIDWRMSSRAIVNLVRALARPYPGAHCVTNGEDVKVWKASTVLINDPSMEPGKIVDTKDDLLLVKSGDAAVLLEQHDFLKTPKPGEYLQ